MSDGNGSVRHKKTPSANGAIYQVWALPDEYSDAPFVCQETRRSDRSL